MTKTINKNSLVSKTQINFAQFFKLFMCKNVVKWKRFAYIYIIHKLAVSPYINIIVCS